jgi:hypothetical protein
MAKHVTKHHKKAARHERAARHTKRARGEKPTRVKKHVTQDQMLGKAAVKQQGLESAAAELQLVDLDALGRQLEGVADVVEIFEVEVVSDAEDTRQGDEPKFTPEDID